MRIAAATATMVVALLASHITPMEVAEDAVRAQTDDGGAATGLSTDPDQESGGEATAELELLGDVDSPGALPGGDDRDDGVADLAVDAPAAVMARWTADDTLAALAGASPRARCIVRTEVGGVGYDPYARGRQGEYGVAQLHPRGLYPDFLREGYTDWTNPWQQVSYLEGALTRGLARHWSGVLRGMC